MKTNKKIILSICIPTFERKEILKKTLQTLIDSEKLVPGKIEVCISDNASKDGTFKMLKKYQKIYPFIRIRKNRKNEGFDSNLAASFNLANGVYCWATGDDDPVIPYGIKRLVGLLEKNERFLLGLSGVAFDKIFKKREFKKREFIEKFSLLINQNSKFLKYRKDSYFLGSISTYFFRNLELKKTIKIMQGKRYGWYHLAVLFYILSNFEGKVLINEKQLQRQGEVGLSKTLYLPGEELDLFIRRRINSLHDIKIENSLNKEFNNWINLRGNYIYIKSLIQLFMLSVMIEKKEYEIIKKKVYDGELNIKLTFIFKKIVFIFKVLERIELCKKMIAQMYILIRPNYSLLIKAYLSRRLKTNDQRNPK